MTIPRPLQYKAKQVLVLASSHFVSNTFILADGFLCPSLKAWRTLGTAVKEQRQAPGLTATKATWGRGVIKIKMPTARTVQVHLCHSSRLALCALANDSEYSKDHLRVSQVMGVPPTKACFQPRSSCAQGKYNPEGNTIEREPHGKMAFITVVIAVFLLVALVGLWGAKHRVYRTWAHLGRRG